MVPERAKGSCSWEPNSNSVPISWPGVKAACRKWYSLTLLLGIEYTVYSEYTGECGGLIKAKKPHSLSDSRLNAIPFSLSI